MLSRVALLFCRPMASSALFRFLPFTLFASAILAGCGSGGTLPTGPSPTGPGGTTYSGAAFSGTVLAGTVPLAGASVQLYAAGTSGNGAGATALLGSALTSDTSGNFSVAAGYTCASATSQIYLVARGGALPPQPPATASSPNPATVLVTAIGDCSSITSGAQVPISDLTTAAAAWALAPFLGADGSVGASTTNALGLTHAISTAANLQSAAAAAKAPTPYNNAVLRLRSAANLLHTCVVLTPSDACSTLFAATTTAGSVPTDTFGAVLSLVRNPGQNVAATYAQSVLSSAFAPALATAPADWTLFLTHSGAGMSSPAAVAIDSTGSVWVTSFFGVASKFGFDGTPTFPSGITGSGLGDSYGLAVDADDNAWIPNRDTVTSGGTGTVTELSSSGQPISGVSGYAAGGFNYPTSLAISPAGSTWVVDYGNSHLTVLSSSGQPLSGTAGYGSDLFAFPVAIAIGSNGDAWIANQGSDALTHVSADGKTFTNSQTFNSGSCCAAASGLAIDAQGNVWVTEYYLDSVSRLSPTGNVLGGSFSGGGVNSPQAIAIDGSGTVWIGNFHGNSLSELAGSASSNPGQPLSPQSAWIPDAGLSEPSGIAVDASGNLWISNFGSDTLTEVIGRATPVKTPLIGPVQLP